MTDEQDLVVRAQNGDRAAFGELLLQQYENLSRLLAPKIPEPMQRTISVDDVLQATFAEAYRNLSNFEYRGAGSLRAWLSTIGDSRLKDMIKAQLAQKRGGDHRQVQKRDEMNSSAADLVEMLSANITSPSRAVSRKEAMRALQIALNALPDLHAQVIRLRFLEGLSLDETAQQMGRTPNAVRALTHRAKQDLRDVFGRLSQYMSRDS